MSIQPGVGFSFRESNHGTTLDINPVWAPYVGDSGTLEQFTVSMDGNKLFTSKGRVVVDQLTSMPTTRTQEYDIVGFAVYPTSSLTVGSDAASPYCSQGGYVTIADASNEGSDAWGVYLIRNVDGGGESGLPTERPFLAVMADGSDAETKSKPWNSTAQHGDQREYYLIRETTSVEVTEPSGVVYGSLMNSVSGAVKRYNCQRIKVASVNWYALTGWVVTQHLIGTLYMPNNVQFYGELTFESGTTAPNDTWPLNSTENAAWAGAWTGYEKHFNDGGLNKTDEILV